MHVTDNSMAAARREPVRLRTTPALRLVPPETPPAPSPASPPPVEEYVDVPVIASRHGETLSAAAARVTRTLSRRYTTPKAREDALQDLRLIVAAAGQIEVLL